MAAQLRFLRSRGWVVALALAVLAIAPGSARADFMFTASGTSSDGPLNAEAYFVLGTDTITLYLANLTSGTQSQGDAISGIKFTVSAPPNNSLSLTSVSGDVVNLSGGTFTGANPLYQTNPSNSKWSATSVNNVTDLGNGAPNFLIVGPNASFNGNGGTNFNPYFQTHATSAENLSTAPQGDSVKFVLNAPGATSASTISNVIFNFGTSPNEHTASGTLTTPVPVPSSMLLALTGFGSFGLMGARQLLRKRVAAA